MDRKLTKRFELLHQYSIAPMLHYSNEIYELPTRMPYLVGETAVRTDGQHLHSKIYECGMIGGDRRQFRGSHKRKISRVETKGHPLPFVIG